MHDIEPRTFGRNGTAAEVLPASAARRTAAFAVDQAIVTAYLASLGALILVVRSIGGDPLLETALHPPFRGQVVGMLLLTLPVVMYFSVCEGSGLQRTLGKRALGIRVEDESGVPLSLERATLRSALKFLPWELTHTILWRIPGWSGSTGTLPMGAILGFALVGVLLGTYVLTMLLSPHGRAPYDAAAGSRVVRDPSGRDVAGSACLPAPGLLPFPEGMVERDRSVPRSGGRRGVTR